MEQGPVKTHPKRLFEMYGEGTVISSINVQQLINSLGFDLERDVMFT